MVIFEEQLSKPTTTMSNNNQDDDGDNQYNKQTNNDTTTIITNVKLKQQQQQQQQSVFNHHLNGFHSKNDDEELNEDQLQTNICSNQTVMNHNNNNNIDSNSNKTEQHIDTIDNHQQENDQDDDDFADFATFMPDSNKKNDADDNFDDDFDDFADFTTTTANNVPEPIITDDDKNIDAIKPLKNSRQLIEDTFPIKTSSIYDDERLSIDFFDKKFCDPNAQQLWNNLQQLDLKLNFHFNKWKQSSSFKHLIESLKIDSRNVIPPDIFPSTTNITLNQILQPTAYDYSATTVTKIDDEDCNGLTMADVFCTTNVNKNLSTTKIESSTSTTTAESFEWPADHSMTTSPSTTTTNQSMLSNNLAQDLDFFETKYVSNNNNNNISNVKNEDHHHNLIAEFDEFLRIDTESAIVNNNEISTKSTTTNKTTNRMNEQVLSAEALQILNELPTLSMMRSKILSYPMLNNHQCRSNSNSPSSSSHHHHS